jgi:WD40 repeat protein
MTAMSIPNKMPLLCIILFLGLTGTGDGKPDKLEKLVDRYGDPLPEGAIARLGTVRFRHGFLARAIAFSPNGNYLASGGRLPGLRLWDATTGRLLNEASHYGVNSLGFSPDSKMILVSSGTPTLIDVASGKELGRFPTVSDFIAFSPDGQMVAAEERDKITLLKVGSRKQIRQLQGHTDQINCLAFSPKGETLATGSQDKTIRIWDVASGTELRRFEVKDEVRAIAFSPNGKFIGWIGDEDSTIRLLDLSGAKAAKLLKGSSGSVYSIAFSPNGKLLASGGLGGKIFLWDANGGKQLRQWQAFGFLVAHVAFSPDGKTLAATGAFGSSAIRLWDTDSGKEIHPPAGHTGMVHSFRFSRDGQKLTSFGLDQRAITWNVENSAAMESAAHIGPFGKKMITTALSPDGKVLATGSWYEPKKESDSLIRLFDTRTGKELHALGKHKEPVGALAFSDDGKILASGGKDGIFLWNPAERTKFRQFPGHQAGTTSLVFSPNGKLLVSTGEDKKVRLWNVLTGKQIHQWDCRGLTKYFKPAFSPDSKFLASFDNNIIRVWEVSSGREITRLPQEFATALAFSPSGRFLASSQIQSRLVPTGEDVNRVYLWDLVSGQVALQIDRKEKTIWSLAFSANGRILASGGGDSTILLWDMTGRLKNGQLLPANLSNHDLKQLWNDLGGQATSAYPAIWTLAADPAQALPFLAKRLQPVANADAKQINRWIGDLESNDFKVRDRAFKELSQLGELAEPALNKARPRQPTVEFRRRIDLLVGKLKGPVTEPERLRTLRAIEVLENIGLPQARKVLERLATGTTAARLTREAQASLQRLKGRY